MYSYAGRDVRRKSARISALLDFFKIFSQYIYYPIKGYIRAKQNVNSPNRCGNIDTFHMRHRRRKFARMAAILNFLKIFNKDIYCPMMGYIRTKNEVNLPNKV